VVTWISTTAMTTTERPDHADGGIRYEYAFGFDNAPGDPFGRIELVIEPGGTARLDHRHVGRHRAWTGRIDDTVLRRLKAELERTDFPDVPRRPIPACSTLRTLTTERNGTRVGNHLPWHLQEEAAGYVEAFRILDSLACQMSGAAVPAPADALPAAVTGLRQIEG
jgi:hypothetical protein